MRNGTVSGTPAQSDGRDDIYHTIVTDLASLVERVHASLMLIESAVAREASAALQEIAANVVVLDDVTPRYLKAGAALKACGAGLGVALHFLREPMTSEPGTHDAAGNPHLTARESRYAAYSRIN